jgi:hypothetical protein
LIWLHFLRRRNSLALVVRTLFYAIVQEFTRRLDDSMETERTALARFTELNSESWQAHVRLKGQYVNETFRKDVVSTETAVG